jgi:hypothetical protein
VPESKRVKKLVRDVTQRGTTASDRQLLDFRIGELSYERPTSAISDYFNRMLVFASHFAFVLQFDELYHLLVIDMCHVLDML